MLFGSTVLGQTVFFMSLENFTILHVAISLVAIATGFVVVGGMLKGRQIPVWTPIFLWTTVATSVSGFGFPITVVTPGIVVGVVSLVVLAAVIYARSVKHLAGGWRKVYIVGAVLAFYLNFFVLIAQSFQKISFLHTLAPTGTEPPFAIAQLIPLVAFVAAGWLAVIRLKPLPIA